MLNFNVERALRRDSRIVWYNNISIEVGDAQLVDWHVKSKCLYLNLFLPVAMSRLCLR